MAIDYPETQYSERHYDGTGPFLKNKDRDEQFYLSNRSFEEINAMFNNSISAAIESYPADLNRPVRVLDVGSGTEAIAGQDIKKKYEEKVIVSNIDIAHSQSLYGAGAVQADALRMPFADGSMDLVYSHQMFQDFEPKDGHSRERSALGEVARVLAPGGMAFIDETYFSGMKEGSSELKALREKLGVEISIGHKPVERERIFLWIREKPHNYLILRKPQA